MDEVIKLSALIMPINFNDSDWTKELFAARACDWTPSSAHQEACVMYAPISREPETPKRCESILSDPERQRADRFVTDEHKSHFKQRRAFRRYCGALALGSHRPLSQIIFAETEKGRPYLPDRPDIQFSFSSFSFGFLGAWSPTHFIGVDIEDETRKLETVELAQQFFSEAEANVVKELGGLARQQTFFQLWTLKEAALKSIGEGLPFGLDAFEFELTPNLRILRAPRGHGDSERLNAHLIRGGNSCAALVTRRIA